MAMAATPPRLDLDKTVGIYKIVWRDGGRTHRKTTGSGDIEEAKRFFGSWLLGGDVASKSAGATVAEALAHYDQNHVEPKIVGKDQARYAMAHLNRAMGKRRLASIDIFACREYALAAAKGSGRRYGPVKAGTIARELSVLQAAAHHCLRWRVIQKSDMPSIELPAKESPRDRWLTKSELARVIDAASGVSPRAFRFVMAAYYTAARRSALESLTWDQVDLDNGRIYLNPTGRRQTKKKRPTIPIHGILLPILEEAYSERAGGKFVFGCGGGSIRTVMKRVMREAGVAGAFIHTFRHTRATHLAQRGVPLASIAELLGDRTTTVERNYLHHSPKHLSDTIGDK